jgi:hypothetical protein
MVSSLATTVSDYLDELPARQREMVRAIRDVVRANIPAGYEEGMLYGGIAWMIPLSRYPETYNGQPLAPVVVIAQKHHVGLYLSVPYGDPSELAWLEGAWAAAGHRLDMGKACVRMRKMADVPLKVIGRFVARTSPRRFIALYESTRGGAMKGGSAKKKAKAKGSAARARPWNRAGSRTAGRRDPG